MKLKMTKNGVWVDFPEGKGEVKFKIRPMHFSESINLMDEVKEKKLMDGMPIDPKDPSKRGFQLVDDYKNGAFLWRMFDHMLEDWRGIEMDPEEGEPMPGPIEVKKAIFNHEGMREFITAKSREMSELVKVERVEEEKNS